MTALQRYLRVQEGFELEIARMLAEAYFDIDVVLRTLESSSLISDAVRAAQVRESQRQIRDQLRVLVGGVGEQVTGYQKIASDAAVSSLYDDLSPFLRQAGLNDVQIDQMIQSQQRTAANGLETAMTRVQKSRIPLSEQVWKTSTLVNGQLDRIINSALARGSSAKEIADAVRAFVNPNTPGGVRYAASRLGRTELNNAFHASQTQAAIDNPWVLSCQWHNSESHPEPDECDELADEDRHGLGPGMFPPEEVPAKPHPQCLCYMTNETPSPEEFIARMTGGEYDEFLEENGVEAQGPPYDKLGSPELDQQLLAAQEEGMNLEAGMYAPGGGYNSANGWNSATFRAWDAYIQDGYVNMNSLLRDPERFLAQASSRDRTAASSHTRQLMKVLGQNQTTRDMTVLRGVHSRDFSGLKVGDVLAEQGFLSTTSSDIIAEQFRLGQTSGGPVSNGWTFVTKVPKGTNAIHGLAEEAEIVLSPGAKQRVLGIDLENSVIYTEIYS